MVSFKYARRQHRRELRSIRDQVNCKDCEKEF
jgi:hypothetical protein